MKTYFAVTHDIKLRNNPNLTIQALSKQNPCGQCLALLSFCSFRLTNIDDCNCYLIEKCYSEFVQRIS